MSRAGLEIFDTTLQETNHWLKRMMEALGTDAVVSAALSRGTATAGPR